MLQWLQCTQQYASALVSAEDSSGCLQKEVKVLVILPCNASLPDFGDLYLCVKECGTELRHRHLTMHLCDWFCSLL